MTADTPTILATSGGVVPGSRITWEVGPLTEYAIDLAGVDGRAPRVCFVATGMGDHPAVLANFYNAAQQRGLAASHLALFPMPNVENVTAHLLAQDVIWVWGGSVAGLLAMWRLHGVDKALRMAWAAGVVDGSLPAGYATDDGVGLLYRGTELVEAITEEDDKAAYYVERGPEGTAVETRVDTRRL